MWIIIFLECSVSVPKFTRLVEILIFYLLGVDLKNIEILVELFDWVTLATIVDHQLAWVLGWVGFEDISGEGEGLVSLASRTTDHRQHLQILIILCKNSTIHSLCQLDKYIWRLIAVSLQIWTYHINDAHGQSHHKIAISSS